MMDKNVVVGLWMCCVVLVIIAFWMVLSIFSNVFVDDSVVNDSVVDEVSCSSPSVFKFVPDNCVHVEQLDEIWCTDPLG